MSAGGQPELPNKARAFTRCRRLYITSPASGQRRSMSSLDRAVECLPIERCKLGCKVPKSFLLEPPLHLVFRRLLGMVLQLAFIIVCASTKYEWTVLLLPLGFTLECFKDSPAAVLSAKRTTNK